MALTKVTYSMIKDAPINVLDYGVVGDGSTDDTVAIQAIFTAGYTNIYFPAGIYKLTAAVTVSVSNTQITGAGIPGTYTSTVRSTGGSAFLVGAGITGSLFTFGSSTNILKGCSISNIGFIDVGTTGTASLRNYAITNAALNIFCDYFNLNNVQFYGIRGTALRTSRCVKSNFSDVSIDYCGASGLSAFRVGGTSASLATQGSTFKGFSIEVTCGGASAMTVTQYDTNNKFMGFGFENAAITSSQGLEASDGIFLSDSGFNNQFSNFHFNRNDLTATNPKMNVAGTKNIYSSFLFAGQRSSDNVYLNNAQFCQFSDFKDSGAAANVALWFVNIAGSSVYNVFTNFTGNATSGINIAVGGNQNTFSQITLADGSLSALTCAGQQNVFTDIYVSDYTTTGSVITISGAFNKISAFIRACATATTGILVSGNYVNVLPKTTIFNLAAANGIEVTGNYGVIDDVEVDTVGVHGIYINGGEPVSVSNNTIINANQLGGTGYGIGFVSGTNKTIGGVCNSNRVIAISGSHTNSIFVTDNAGSPRYDYWTFVGNNTRNGGSVSISTGNNIIASNRS